MSDATNLPPAADEVAVYQGLVTYLETAFPGLSLSEESTQTLLQSAATIADENTPHDGGHTHNFNRLVEEGYVRLWYVSPSTDGRLSAYGDSFTEDGDGNYYLQCACGSTTPLAHSIDWD